jgi:mRNA-degrading endonuclease YafQ of YafQ-DinJ toxin-antitoxin module
VHIVQKLSFQRDYKKLHANQKRDMDEAICAIMADPAIGEPKVGDLTGIQVHKFKMVGQQILLAYSYHDEIVTLMLLMFGSHENFYKDLKKSIR